IVSANDTLPMGEAARESWRFRQLIMAECTATAEPAQTVVKVGSDYYVLASSLATRRANQVLANGRSFAVFETAGDIIDSRRRGTRIFQLRYAASEPLRDSDLSDPPPHGFQFRGAERVG